MQRTNAFCVILITSINFKLSLLLIVFYFMSHSLSRHFPISQWLRRSDVKTSPGIFVSYLFWITEIFSLQDDDIRSCSSYIYSSTSRLKLRNIVTVKYIKWRKWQKFLKCLLNKYNQLYPFNFIWQCWKKENTFLFNARYTYGFITADPNMHNDSSSKE